MAAPRIGTLNESSLHSQLKAHYQRAGDALEVPVAGFVVDIVRAANEPDELLIEIQTAAFGAMGNKLDQLLDGRRMLLVHPIAVETRLIKPGARARRSPKRGSIYALFEELVSIPTLLDHPNLSLEVVLLRVAKVQVEDPKARRGRGGFRTVDRSVDEILSTHRFESAEDLLRLLPDDLPSTFTTADLASSGLMNRDAARRLAYCFKAIGLIESTGRTRTGYHYRLTARGRGVQDPDAQPT